MARQKTGRMCTAEEVAYLCVYLASDEVSVRGWHRNVVNWQSWRGRAQYSIFVFCSSTVDLRDRDGADHRWRLETVKNIMLTLEQIP